MTYFYKQRQSLPAFEDKPVLSLKNTRNIERTFKAIKLIAKENNLSKKNNKVLRIKLHNNVVKNSLVFESNKNKLPVIASV